MKGILFKPDIIKVIIEGRKTVTRRLMKPQPHYEKGVLRWDKGQISINMDDHSDLAVPFARYQVGETVYIKEAWTQVLASNSISKQIVYKLNAHPNAGFEWHSPLFMPAWAARHFIQILDVRAERLQEITEEDATAEGCQSAPGLTIGGNIGLGSARYWYVQLWDSINKPPYDWENNPWVWRYEFKSVPPSSKQG